MISPPPAASGRPRARSRAPPTVSSRRCARRSARGRERSSPVLVNAALVLGSMYIFGHWIAGVAIAVLILIWKLLPQDEGPPVLALALTAQWVQVSLGVFYVGISGRSLEA